MFLWVFAPLFRAENALVYSLPAALSERGGAFLKKISKNY